jgi:hypothetical protein
MKKSDWKAIRGYNILNQKRLDKNARLLANIYFHSKIDTIMLSQK